MKTIPKYLIEKMVSVTHGSWSVEEFETWLYQNDTLAEQITKNDFVLELYDLNYKRKDVKHELQKLGIAAIGKNLFQMYQTKILLEGLSLDLPNQLGILDQLYDLSINYQYNFLDNLAHCYFVVEDCDLYHQPVPVKTKNYIIREANTLLKTLNQAIDNDQTDLHELSYASRPSLYDLLKEKPTEDVQQSVLKDSNHSEIAPLDKGKKTWWNPLRERFKFHNN